MADIRILDDGMLVVFGDQDPRAIAQARTCLATEEGSFGVQSADGHLGYSAPIGMSWATRDHVSPAAVGYDIGCGNLAVCTELEYDEIEDDLAGLMDTIASEIDFGIGRREGRMVDHPIIDEIAAASFEPQRTLATVAAAQLGTVGGGNHYVDLFRDEHDRVWIGVHFGSRGFGHKTASGFMVLAAKDNDWRAGHGGIAGEIEKAFHGRPPNGEMESAPDLLAVESGLGEAYLDAMDLAGRYAHAGREHVVRAVLAILGTGALDDRMGEGLWVHNHHNFAWHELHGGEELYVTRKGATPAFPGQYGFVGATMGEEAAIVRGVESVDSRRALSSTVHGAGRQLSRTKAAGKWKKRWVNNAREDGESYEHPEHATAAARKHGIEKPKLRKVRVRIGGSIDYEAVKRSLAAEGIELRGGGADEAPGAYKRLTDVLAAHEGTIEVVERLRPIGVAMAPEDTFDPFKD